MTILFSGLQDELGDHDGFPAGVSSHTHTQICSCHVVYVHGLAGGSGSSSNKGACL